MVTTHYDKHGASKGRFGTFSGVFIPNVLTILGLIFFLRIGWVVGEMGLIRAMVIVGIANLISLLTGLSLSAISTSMTVKTGGAYYILSRTLGLEVGGAIGIPLYLSQAVSVAFYVIGFTESLVALNYMAADYAPIAATVIVIVFGTMAYLGADFIVKAQYVILAVLMVAIASFFMGGWEQEAQIVTGVFKGSDETFWSVFAVFFPAVTGIAVGASMSGDLKEPSKSIPRGTLASIVFTALIYIFATYWVGSHATREELLSDKMVMQRIALWPALIIFGVWAATLSSALGSVMAAPRTLQALAFDRVVPKVVASQLGSEREPRFAVIVTTILAVSIIWMGDLNFVATIITMFFLNTYGIINLSAGIEKLVGNPSYRPKFNIHWGVSILGAIGCYSAMLLINVPATLIVMAVSFLVFVGLERRSIKSDFGDVRSGVWFAVARHSLLRLEEKGQEIKNWRPNIVVFTGQTHRREYLYDVGEWLSRGRGIVSFVQLLAGNTSELATSGLREAERRQMRAALKERGISGFADCQITASLDQGALTVAQSHGISGLEPNTILMGYPKKEERRLRQFELLRSLAAMKKSVLILKHDSLKDFGKKEKIDIWWSGRSRNGELMLMLAHIITRHRSWDDAKIRVLQIVRNEEQVPHTEDNLRRTLESVRVQGDVLAVVPESGASIAETISRASADADLTIVGMRLPELSGIEEMARATDELVSLLGSVLLVRSAEVEDLLGV